MGRFTNAPIRHQVSRGYGHTTKKPDMINGMPIFEWRSGVPVQDMHTDEQQPEDDVSIQIEERQGNELENLEEEKVPAIQEK